MHSGAPFAKKGGSDISLPKMDNPVNLMQSEVYLPEQYKVKDFGGDAIAANLLPPASADVSGAEGQFTGLDFSGDTITAAHFFKDKELSLLPGQLGGIVVDSHGAAIPNAQITVVQSDNGAVRKVVTDPSGHWTVSNLPAGTVKVTTDAPGFQRLESDFYYDGSRPVPVSAFMNVAGMAETVTVTAAPSQGDALRAEHEARAQAQKQQTAASSNVTSLQQRVSGVLPVHVDVPRAGNSYHFVRPLVLDEETKVTFTYKSK